ncbi:MAG: pentapeptide repeat-containing protein, partial [Phormidesmis sp. CAN_BIN44]|nr:pentapeptide repeat-containing protein [Phormidesmis sp. CAN_BIN44]
NGAKLNVANLTMADLREAKLVQAELIKAELTRSDLSGADLRGANLSNADLRDAKLRYANLSQTNLSRADLRHAILTEANLEQANLTSSDLSSTDLTGADLNHAELRQTNLSRANLQGANLSGANLRWADLSGANLRWADLTGAKLSGANLTGADLSHATLLNATLVHVDLTRANLANADWSGADLSGSTMTGIKLHGVSPFGIKTAGATCRWIDLSQNGDQSQIYTFATDSCQEYFNETPPIVEVVIDARLDTDANCALAVTYQQVARQCGFLAPPPEIEVHLRRTTLTFRLERDEQLLIAAYVAIFPFEDNKITQQTLMDLLHQIPTQKLSQDAGKIQQFQQLVTVLSQQVQQVNAVKLLQSIPIALKKMTFFQAPTKTVLVNSNNQRLTLYHNPKFGKHPIATSQSDEVLSALNQIQSFKPPSLETAIEFVKGFHPGLR